jgi:mono/diheme cytochrome c family protein
MWRFINMRYFLAVVILAGLCASGSAADVQSSHGHALLQQYCGRCHAVGSIGKIPVRARRLFAV